MPIETGLGAALRDEGIALVTANNENWFDEAKQIATNWLGGKVGLTVTGEDITATVTKSQATPPKSPNAWGALTRSLITAGHLQRTGQRVAMTAPRSHARTTDVYRVLQCAR